MRIGITEAGDACFHKWDALSVVDGAILISKNIKKLWENLNPELYSKVILHATITGMGGSMWEPGAPLVGESVDFFNSLEFPEEQLVLRVDPIMPTDEGVAMAIEVMKAARTDCRIRISFMDAYDHIKARIPEWKWGWEGLPVANKFLSKP